MPTFDPIEASSQFASDRVFEVVQSKYVTAGNYAVWAQGLLETSLKDIKDKLDNNELLPALQDLLALVDAIQSYTPGTVAAFDAPNAPVYKEVPDYTSPTLGTLMDIPDYEAPTKPSLLSIPAYSGPVLGSMLGIPTIKDISIPDAPSTAVTFTNAAFSDSLLTAIKSQVESDLGTGGEAAMFERHRQRVTDEQNDAQIEVTVQFSSRGFDLPTGAWQSQNRRAINNKSKRLTDVSADIMQARNQQAMSAGVQLLDMLGRLHDSKIMRDFDAAKTTVQLSLEGFKAIVEAALTEANLEKAKVDAVVATNKGTIDVFLGELQGQLDPIKSIANVNQSLVQAFDTEVKAAVAPINAAVDVNKGIIGVYLGEVEGQTAPMKAIADVNQASASAYSSAVQAATGAVQASVIPEDLKIKQVQTQIETAKTKAGILSDTTKMAIDDAYRHTNMSVETLKAVSLQAAQMIAASWNTVGANVSYDYRASANTSYNGNVDDLSANVKYQVDGGKSAGVN